MDSHEGSNSWWSKSRPLPDCATPRLSSHVLVTNHPKVWPPQASRRIICHTLWSGFRWPQCWLFCNPWPWLRCWRLG